MLPSPCKNAPTITNIAMIMTAVRYLITRVETAVPKAFAASLVPSDHPMKSPDNNNKYIIGLMPFW